MKRASRLWVLCVTAMLCIAGAVHFSHTKSIYAQQSYNPVYDGEFFISASVEVDSNYILYTDSYMQVEFDDYEDIDSIEVDAYVDEDNQVFYSDDGEGDDNVPAEVALQSNNPVDTGHEYGVESVGSACFDDGEGDQDCEYINSAYASVSVASSAPQITSIAPSMVYQRDTGTLTITGSNFIVSTGDQLTLNFSGGGGPFTLTSTPATCTTNAPLHIRIVFRDILQDRTLYP